MSNKLPLDFFLDFLVANGNFPAVDRTGNQPSLRFSEDETSSLMEYHFPRDGEQGVIRYHDGSLKGLFADQLSGELDPTKVGVYEHNQKLYAVIRPQDLVHEHLVAGGYEFAARYVKEARQGDDENGDDFDLEVDLKLPFMKGTIRLISVLDIASTLESVQDPVQGHQELAQQETPPAEYKVGGEETPVVDPEPEEQQPVAEKEEQPKPQDTRNKNKHRN